MHRKLASLLALGLFACQPAQTQPAGPADPSPDRGPGPSLTPDLGPGSPPVSPEAGAPAVPDAQPLAACDDSTSVLLDPSDPRAMQADAILAQSFGGNQPGAAALLILDGKVLLRKGYGKADLASGAPITPCSTFDLASVTKHFTAAAILLLVQEGKLKLEDPVKTTLPELAAGSAGNPIRLRHLLQQTSGLIDYLVLTENYSDAAFGALRTEDVLQLVKNRPLDFPTGSKWAYSNTNFSLAALTVERVTKVPFSRFLHDRFFVPLAMKDTLSFDESAAGVPRRVTGYTQSKGKFLPSQLDAFIDGDGNVFTSVHDLERWEASWRTPTLLSPASVALAYAEGKTSSGAATGYGLGWFLDRSTGKLIAWHSGGWYGTSTLIERHLELGLTIVLLSNNESRDPSTEAAQLAALFQ